MSRDTVRSLTWHSSQRFRTDCCFAADGLPSVEQALSWLPITLQTGPLHGDCSLKDFLWYPGRSWLGPGDAARVARPECSLRHCRPRHPPDKATKVVRCRWNCTCMDFIIYPSRQQSVTFNGHQSTRIQLKCGVPQGSVLRPLLFILYTSDVIPIAAQLGVGAHSYADDSRLYLHCPAIDQMTATLRLAECIERVEG